MVEQKWFGWTVPRTLPRSEGILCPDLVDVSISLLSCSLKDMQENKEHAGTILRIEKSV